MLYSFSASLVVQDGGATTGVVVVMAGSRVEKNGNCNVVGGLTGSGEYATAEETPGVARVEI
jgi:hypothetical protein